MYPWNVFVLLWAMKPCAPSLLWHFSEACTSCWNCLLLCSYPHTQICIKFLLSWMFGIICMMLFAIWQAVYLTVSGREEAGTWNHWDGPFWNNRFIPQIFSFSCITKSNVSIKGAESNISSLEHKLTVCVEGWWGATAAESRQNLFRAPRVPPRQERSITDRLPEGPELYTQYRLHTHTHMLKEQLDWKSSSSLLMI